MDESNLLDLMISLVVPLAVLAFAWLHMRDSSRVTRKALELLADERARDSLERVALAAPPWAQRLATVLSAALEAAADQDASNELLKGLSDALKDITTHDEPHLQDGDGQEADDAAGRGNGVYG